jgi:cytochrome c-type biogenesis protein CcmE
MNRINDELRDALGKPSAQSVDQEPTSGADPQPSVVANAPKDAARGKRSWGLLVGLLAMGAAILVIVFTGIDNAAVYSKGVDELLGERVRFESRNVRVLGTLARGSLLRRDEPCEYRFRMQKGGAELEVHYPQCVIPDTFRDVPGVDVEVTAEGRLQKDGTFLAHQIMAKCPSKYDMTNRAQSGQDIPHQMQLPTPNSMRPLSGVGPDTAR